MRRGIEAYSAKSMLRVSSLDIGLSQGLAILPLNIRIRSGIMYSSLHILRTFQNMFESSFLRASVCCIPLDLVAEFLRLDGDQCTLDSRNFYKPKFDFASLKVSLVGSTSSR